MIFIETPVFTKLIVDLIDDESYLKLQAYLIKNPEIGKVVPRGGGVRKIRWNLFNTGKSGGVRII